MAPIRLVLVVAAAGARTTEPRGGTALWGLAGLGAVAATVAHPRGFAVDVAVVLLAAVVRRSWPLVTVPGCG